MKKKKASVLKPKSKSAKGTSKPLVYGPRVSSSGKAKTVTPENKG